MRYLTLLVGEKVAFPDFRPWRLHFHSTHLGVHEPRSLYPSSSSNKEGPALTKANMLHKLERYSLNYEKKAGAPFKVYDYVYRGYYWSVFGWEEAKRVLNWSLRWSFFVQFDPCQFEDRNNQSRDKYHPAVWKHYLSSKFSGKYNVQCYYRRQLLKIWRKWVLWKEQDRKRKPQITSPRFEILMLKRKKAVGIINTLSLFRYSLLAICTSDTLRRFSIWYCSAASLVRARKCKYQL